MTWIKLNRLLRKGDIFKMDSLGMYPQCDNRYYRTLDKFRNHPELRNIQEIDPETWKDLPVEHSQIIVRFTEGYNKFVYIKS